jgi:hypothetical protein
MKSAAKPFLIDKNGLCKWAIFDYISILLGGFEHVLSIMKNMKVNGKDDIPYMKWKMKNVPNHQPAFNGDNM